MINVLRSYENIEFEDYKSELIFIKLLCKQGIKLEKIIEYEDEDIDIDEKIYMENLNGDIYLNIEFIKDIFISNLWDVIMENLKNENDGFKKEYVVCSYDIYI